MRPLRGLIVCTATLFFLLFVLAWKRSGVDHDGPTASARTRIGRLRALFSFHTPDSLFPPSALISLTDDNSTIFVARPAAYGPSLPSSGLSGQLWIGSGFAEEGGASMNAEGELGCSDVPGWPYNGQEDPGSGKSRIEANTKVKTKQVADGLDKLSTDATVANTKDRSSGKSSQLPPSNDGTDNELHWPLRAAPWAKGVQLDEKEQNGSKDFADKEHADIQSIQEGAEIAGKVVLLSRGGCGFLEKTKWVQRRGGVALIVGNNIRDPTLISMHASEDTSNVTIPSIFTSHLTAHLLSSLMSSGRLINSAPTIVEAATLKSGPGPVKQPAKNPSKADTRPTAIGVSGTRPSGSKNHGWLSKIAHALGIRSGRSASDDRRFPNSGRISWVQSENWDDEITPQQTAQSKKGGSKSTSSDQKSSQHEKQPEDDFVIGIHDWRDPDLVAQPREGKQKQTASTKVTTYTSTPASKSDQKKSVDGKEKTFAGGNIVPGSGRYSIPGQSSEGDQPVEESAGWFGRFFGSEEEESSIDPGAEDYSNDKTGSQPSREFLPIPPLVDTPTPREGLWVTITPTTMSSSPFIDTLLVLVVSPLVTLTVVYALLILRARIQRRRWRAPKSVVERLPVRVYHTMSSSSASTSTHIASGDTSSAASPLLQPQPHSSLSRTRPRSRTTTSINESSALTLERQREDLSSRFEKRKYRGKQIECVVCLEEYIDGQSQVMSLPCGHEFHAECITPWLTTRRRTCPICKGDVVRSLASSSESASDAASEPSHSTDNLQGYGSSRSRSESRNSRTRLLPNDDLERGARAARSPSRFSWQTITGWFNRHTPMREDRPNRDD